MSDNSQPSTPPLQFDVAEYADPQASSSSCAACKQPIAQSYYTANGAIICSACYTRYHGQPDGTSKFRRALTATGLGLAAGLAGALLWYAVRKVSGYELGIIAVVVGFLVGAAVRKGSRNRGGWFYQTLAIVLTYSCISAQYVPDIAQEFYNKYHKDKSAVVQPARNTSATDAASAASSGTASVEAPTATTQPAARSHNPLKRALAWTLLLILALILSLALPFFGGAQNIIGILIIGFALYEAWKLNKRPQVQFAGPFALTPPPVPGIQQV